MPVTTLANATLTAAATCFVRVAIRPGLRQPLSSLSAAGFRDGHALSGSLRTVFLRRSHTAAYFPRWQLTKKL